MSAIKVSVACQRAQQLRSAYHQRDITEGRGTAEKIVDTFQTCQTPEVARLGRTLRHWRAAFLANFTTGRSSNGVTWAVNGIIELHRRRARGYRNPDNYRLRMLLAAGGFTP
uniref:transposase n=1 Tax=Pseudoclavibacter helvolus TaxID=255205 RepID=UPI003735014D